MQDHECMTATTSRAPKKLRVADTQQPQSQSDERLIRIQGLCLMTSLARTTVYAKIHQGDFPQPVRLHGKCVAWKVSEVNAWIDALPRASEERGAQ